MSDGSLGLSRVGDYEVLMPLKSGGMGQVLLGRKRGAFGFEKLVAIKTIREVHLEKPGLRSMFLDEAKLVARLDHPTIAQVYDFGDENGLLFLVMEYVSGVSFAELRRKRADPLPPAIAARMMAEVCHGLQSVHELRDAAGDPLEVVHRDISPDNLILTFEGRIKILDFGIARSRDRESPDTSAGTLKGKPRYMAPEQVDSGQSDRRSDIFASGVVLWELLTGAPLFEGDSVVDVIQAVKHMPIEPPSTRQGGLPPGLDDAVMRALARDPEQRYADARSFADALNQIATAAGGASIETFADAQLCEVERVHRRFLEHVLDGGDPDGLADTVVSRMTDLATLAEGDDVVVICDGTALHVPAATTVASGKARVEQGVSNTARQETALVAGRPAVTERVTRPKVARTAGIVVLLLAGVAGLALGTWWAGRATPAPDPVTPPPPLSHTRTDTPPAVDERVPAEDSVATHSPSKRAKRKSKRAKAKVREPVVVPEAAGSGYLSVDSRPFALLRIDGGGAQATPVERHALPVGKHTIELIHPATRKVQASRRVLVESGRDKRLSARVVDQATGEIKWTIETVVIDP